ncbi:MAG: hypothetical protein ACLVEJ_01875 [Parabacteroides sp.]
MLTLYDLFGFSAEERRRAELGISRKRQPPGAKRSAYRGLVIRPGHLPLSGGAQKERNAENTTPPERDPEDLAHASLELGGPPINGTTEMMMSLTPGTEAEMLAKRLGGRKPEQQERQYAPDGSPEDGQTSRHYAENGQPGSTALDDHLEEEEPGIEMPQMQEADMKPRPFEVGRSSARTLVTDGQNRVGLRS